MSTTNSIMNEKLNDENIVVVASYIQNLVGEDIKIDVKTNDEKYNITFNGLTLLTLDSSNTIEEAIMGINSAFGVNPQNKEISPTSRGRKNLQIAVNFGNLQDTLSIYESMVSTLGNTNVVNPTYITGELRSYYDGLNDDTKTKTVNLVQYINGLQILGSQILSMYASQELKNYKNLEGEISKLFGSFDEFNNSLKETTYTLPVEGETITVDEYFTFLSNLDELRESSYQIPLENFKSELALRHQLFLRDTVPEIFNRMVEDAYFQTNELDVNSEKYQEGLVEFKNNFSISILTSYGVNENFDVNQSNVPAYLWNDSTDYERALYLLSYSDTGVARINFNKAFNIDSYEGNCYDFMFDYLEESKKIFDLENYEGKNIEEVIKEFQKKYQELVNEKHSFEIAPPMENLLRGLQYQEGFKTKWCEAIQRMYGEKYSREYTQDEIFTETYNNNEFLSLFAKDGHLYDFFYGLCDGNENAIYNLNYEFNRGRGNSNLSPSQFYLLNSMDLSLLENIATPFNELLTKKNQIDASISNMKIGMAQNIDTSNITEEDIRLAREYFGSDWQYLDDWQKESYAAVYLYQQANRESILKEYYANPDYYENIDPDLYLRDYGVASCLQNDVFGNIIASRKGFKEARSEFMTATNDVISEGIKNLTRINLYGDIFQFNQSLGFNTLYGFRDGLFGSVEGVYNFFLADGKYSSSDYRKMYYQEFLTADYELYRKYLNNDSEVLKMLEDDDGNKRYEVLFQNGEIDEVDYYKYSRLNELKDDTSLIERLSSLDGKWLLTGASNLSYNLASSVGNMAIPMALSAFIGPEAMSLWTFASVTGNEREKLLKAGRENNGTTFLQAGLVGLLAVMSERMLGSLKGYGKREGDILGIFKNFEKYGPLKQTMASMLSNSVIETEEELFENIGNYFIKAWFENDIPSIEEIGKETWQTIYMTMLSTPLINMMGEGFQNINVNIPRTININGAEIICTPGELMQLVDRDGNINNGKFVRFLEEKGIDYNDLDSAAADSIRLYKLSQESDHSEREKILKRLSTDQAKIEALQYLGDNLSKSDVIRTLSTDQAKIDALRYLTSNDSKLDVIQTLSTDWIKVVTTLDYLNYDLLSFDSHDLLSYDSDDKKLVIEIDAALRNFLKKMPDDVVFDLLSDVTNDFKRAIIIRNLSTPKAMFEGMCQYLSNADAVCRRIVLRKLLDDTSEISIEAIKLFPLECSECSLRFIEELSSKPISEIEEAVDAIKDVQSKLDFIFLNKQIHIEGRAKIFANDVQSDFSGKAPYDKYGYKGKKFIFGFDTIYKLLDKLESEGVIADKSLEMFKGYVGENVSNISLNDDGTYAITTKYGKLLTAEHSDLTSYDFITEIFTLNHEYDEDLISDWIEQNVASMGLNITSKKQSIIDKQLTEIATRIGATNDEVCEAINSALARIIGESEFGMNVNDDILSSILKDLKMKNGQESETSVVTSITDPYKSGYWTERRNLEFDTFGVPHKLDDSDRPIYGILFPNLDSYSNHMLAEKYYGVGPASDYAYYGRIKDHPHPIIIFDKDKVSAFTSFTIGDSIDYNVIKGDGIVSGAPVNNPRFTGAFSEFLKNVTSIEDIKNADLLTFAPLFSKKGHQYIEIQIHGKYNHLIDAIKEVIFYGKEKDFSNFNKKTEQLRRLGIPWRVIHREVEEIL